MPAFPGKSWRRRMTNSLNLPGMPPGKIVAILNAAQIRLLPGKKEILKGLWNWSDRSLWRNLMNQKGRHLKDRACCEKLGQKDKAACAWIEDIP